MRKFIRLAASAVGIVAFTAGCGDQTNLTAPTPTVPSGESATMATTTSTTVKLPVLKRLLPLGQDISVSKNVGILGGTFLIPQAGLTVVIPPLALKTTTKITITARKGSNVYYDMAPHGLKFALPVSVVQVTALTNAAGNLNILSTVTGGYLPNGQADISSSGIASFTQLFRALHVGPAMVFTTKHFSGYAFGSGRTEAADKYEYSGDDAGWVLQ